MAYLFKPKAKKKHTVSQTEMPKKRERAKVYSSKLWADLRTGHLISRPLCECCLLEDKITPAIDVHHLISFTNYQGAERLFYAYDSRNLASLCKECHWKIHHNEDFRAKYTAKLQEKNTTIW